MRWKALAVLAGCLAPLEAAPPAVQAEMFPLNRVRLSAGPFLDAQTKNAEYLPALNPDRLLARFRLQAGLPARAPSYAGWEAMDLAGHSPGHYLSALSLHYASSGDLRVLPRVQYIVEELAACRSRNPDGLVDAQSQFRPRVWREFARGEFRDVKRHNINGCRAPWYTIHKTYAGLRDAWLYTGNAGAREVFPRLADWAGSVLRDLTPAQIQLMLDCEFGGMNEVLADAYALTKKEHKLGLYGGWFQSFGMPEGAFWCCTGTGMENPGRYTEAIYAHRDARLWVNLFAPSTLDWPEQGVKLTQSTRFPEQTTTTLRLSLGQPARLTIHLRVPGWARNATAAVNGKPEAGKAQPGSYLALTRTWTSGDTITLGLPMSPRHEATPDNPKRVAFFYGPVLLALNRVGGSRRLCGGDRSLTVAAL